MIVTIKTGEGENEVVTNYDINNVSEEHKKQEATVIVQKVGTLQVVIEALDFASRTHRANLEHLLSGCEEAIVEENQNTTEVSKEQ